MLRKLVKKGADLRAAVREIQEQIAKGLIGGTKEFILDPATVGFGVPAGNITTYATLALMNAAVGGHGNWAFCQQDSYYYCYNAMDVTFGRTVGWKQITQRDVKLQPYIAGSNGEQRVMVKQPSGVDTSEPVMIILPCIDFAYPAEVALAQALKSDFKYEVDTSQCTNVFVVAADTTNSTSNTPVIGGAPIALQYYGDAGDEGRCWYLSEKKHLQLEFYPEGLPGAYTRTAWTPVSGIGLLFKTSTGFNDGWGNNATFDSTGNLVRYTVPEKSALALEQAAGVQEVADFTFTTADGKTITVKNGVIVYKV